MPRHDTIKEILPSNIQCVISEKEGMCEATIVKGNQRISLGVYPTKEEACRVWDAKVSSVLGNIEQKQTSDTSDKPIVPAALPKPEESIDSKLKNHDNTTPDSIHRAPFGSQVLQDRQYSQSSAISELSTFPYTKSFQQHPSGDKGSLPSLATARSLQHYPNAFQSYNINQDSKDIPFRQNQTIARNPQPQLQNPQYPMLQQAVFVQPKTESQVQRPISHHTMPRPSPSPGISQSSSQAYPQTKYRARQTAYYPNPQGSYPYNQLIRGEYINQQTMMMGRGYTSQPGFDSYKLANSPSGHYPASWRDPRRTNKKRTGSRLANEIPKKKREMPFQCKVCQKKFMSKGSLVRHARIHNGEGFKCEHCRKVFCDNASYQIHLRVHTGEKPHQCRVCGRRFTQRGNLQRHVFTHQPRDSRWQAGK